MRSSAARAALPVLAGVLIALALPAAAGAQGCAMCGTVGQGANDPLVKGMFWSIIFMVSMPFTVVGAVATWLVVQVRRGDATPTAPGDPEARPSPVVKFRRPRP